MTTQSRYSFVFLGRREGANINQKRYGRIYSLRKGGLPQLVSKTRHTLATARRCCESYREGFPASSLLASKSLPMVNAAFLGPETPQRLRIATLKISDTLLLDGLDRRDLFFASRRLWKSTFGATLKRPCTRRILSL